MIIAIFWMLENLETYNQSPNISRVMRKPVFSICENKDADQLRGTRETDKRLCFRYMDSTIHIIYQDFNASNHLLWLYSCVWVGPGRKP